MRKYLVIALLGMTSAMAMQKGDPIDRGVFFPNNQLIKQKPQKKPHKKQKQISIPLLEQKIVHMEEIEKQKILYMEEMSAQKEENALLKQKLYFMNIIQENENLKKENQNLKEENQTLTDKLEKMSLENQVLSDAFHDVCKAINDNLNN